MKQKFIDLYMDWAARVAELSHARRLHVGAVIVKDDTVISYGYNGTPAGWDNDCETVETTFDERDTYHSNDWQYDAEKKQYYRLKTKPEVLHAERNALDKLAKRGGVGSRDASMFVTHAPCLECAKSIYGAGIKEVYYKDQYRSTDGIEFLQKCGITIQKYD